MFTCRNCTRDIYRVLLAVSTESRGQTARSTHRQIVASGARRAEYSTAPRRQQEAATRARIDGRPPVGLQTYQQAGNEALKGNTSIRNYQRHNEIEANPTIREDLSVLEQKPIDKARLQKVARLELEWISESYKLADRALMMLKNGDVDQALEMVRMAGTDGMNATVSWNHILNAVSKTGKLDIAWKLFNEMKKRGQKPDSYTITILLKGYQMQAKEGRVDFSTALKIYESTYAPNSSVKPIIIHANSMLEICARSRKLQLMFSVAAKLPKHGQNAPDQITYTTIFNALHDIDPKDQGENSETIQRRVDQARRIWVDVLERWKSGSFAMGEQLVCAMGRILLKSNNSHDRDDILSLLEQTLRIPRQFEPLDARQLAKLKKSKPTWNTKGRTPADVQRRLTAEKEAADAKLDSTAIGVESMEDLNTMFDKMERGDGAVNQEQEQVDEDQPVQETQRSRVNDFLPLKATNLIYSKPGVRTLSLALKACGSLNNLDGAKQYWNLLSKTTKPDQYNYEDYMAILNAHAASAAATDLLRDMYKASRRGRDFEIKHVVFYHAMGACATARWTKTALRDATRVVAIVQMVYAEPQARLVSLLTSILSHDQITYPLEDVIRGEDALMMSFWNIKSLYAFGRTGEEKRPEPSESLEEVMKEIDSKWAPLRVHEKVLDQRTLTMEQRTSLSEMDRDTLRDVGRRIERAISRCLERYGSAMTQKQMDKMRDDLGRVRQWLFPRGGFKGQARYQKNIEDYVAASKRTDRKQSPTKKSIDEKPRRFEPMWDEG